jgi:ectoine hydroxylase-related dioxygenase (phytanoyl-CoA dioxygenase family)
MNYNILDHGFTVVEDLYSDNEIDSFDHYNHDSEFPFQEGDPKSAIVNFDFSRAVKKANEIKNADFEVFMQKMYFKTAFESSYEMYHQDYFYRQNEGLPNSNYLQVFIALADLEHAPLNVFVGSHLEGVKDHTLGMERQGIGKYRIKNDLLRPLAKNFVSLKVKKGSAVFFDYLLIHGSASNATPFDQPRAVVQLTKGKLNKIIHGADRRDFEIDILTKMLEEKTGAK